MSIRIVPQSERSAAVAQAEPVLLPSTELPYAARAARLSVLAQGHAMSDYLLWAADLAQAQQAVAQALPLDAASRSAVAQAVAGGAGTQAPLHSAHWPRSAHWHALLDALLQQLPQHSRMHTPEVEQARAALAQASAVQREAWADALLAVLRSDAEPAEGVLPQAGIAQLLWAALSLYWRQLASQLPAVGEVESVGERHMCPVCGHAPTGSLILDGTQAGLRYLQCSLCESQWHVVRSKCTNCDGLAQLDYWCLESEKAAIKAESCNGCHSYLKAFYKQVDRDLEIVADDLASLALDAEMDGKGLERSAVNPLMLPL